MTSAMINNYVKLKLIPKAEKKRYNRITYRLSDCYHHTETGADDQRGKGRN
ncbi:MAG: DUF1836 domain-containing protein [[Clostridium] innocuum]